MTKPFKQPILDTFPQSLCYNHPKHNTNGSANLNPDCIVTALFEGRESATFTKEGMVGVVRKNPNRPVSLISLQARQAVDQATERGLCFKKFVADITVDCEQMPPTGALLKSGDFILQILPERKRCWPECELLEKKLPCPLIDGVRYAGVYTPGNLCTEDAFTIISEEKTTTPGN
jgi:hypothetical protein